MNDRLVMLKDQSWSESLRFNLLYLLVQVIWLQVRGAAHLLKQRADCVFVADGTAGAVDEAVSELYSKWEHTPHVLLEQTCAEAQFRHSRQTVAVV